MKERKDWFSPAIARSAESASLSLSAAGSPSGSGQSDAGWHGLVDQRRERGDADDLQHPLDLGRADSEVPAGKAVLWCDVLLQRCHGVRRPSWPMYS